MTAEVVLDGQAVKLKSSAALIRMYRDEFGADILTEANGDKDKVEVFENLAYLMAKHADPEHVPATPAEWMEGFSVTGFYQLLPVVKALWDGNLQALDVAKKKLEQSTVL